MSSNFRRVFTSTVGTKLLIGVTGVALFAYMILHLIGNVLIFGGQSLFNRYSHSLITNPLIVPVEVGLLVVFLLHIYKTIVNYLRNTTARPIPYAKKEYAGRTSRKSLASSTMIFSGLFLVLFLVVHVKQFKYGAYYETQSSTPIRDLYRTEVEVFKQPLWVLFYVLGTFSVGLHLRHGIASGFQSLGLDHPLYTRRLTTWGVVLAILIGGGLMAVPIWVYFTR